jgi:hypothetical protein
MYDAKLRYRLMELEIPVSMLGNGLPLGGTASCPLLVNAIPEVFR